MQLTKSGFFKVMILLLAGLKLVTIPLVSSDLYIWVAEGLKLLSSPALIHTDISSIHHLVLNYPSHLSNLLLGVIYDYFGDLGLIILLRLYLFIFLGYFVALKSLRNRDIDFKTFGVAVISMVGSEFMVDRPAIFALPFIWYFVSLFHKIKLEQKINWLIYIFVIALWTNLHPSSIIIIPLSLYGLFISRFNKRVFLLLILGLLSLHLTPIGLGIWRYAYDTIIVSHGRQLDEWTSILRFNFPNYAFLYLATLFTTLTLAIKKRKFNALFHSIYFPLMIIGLFSARNTTFLFLFLLPIYQRFSLIEESDQGHQPISLLDKLILSLVSLLLIFMAYNNPLYEEGARQLQYLGPSLGSSVFTRPELAGTICAVTANRSHIFMDTRNIIFSQSIFKDYFAITNGRKGALKKLDSYSIDTIYLPKSDRKINKLLSSSSHWKQEFAEGNYQLWRRR